MENIIYNELRYRGYNVDVGVVESVEKVERKSQKKQYEIDFIASLGSKRYYLQSAYDIPSEEKKWHKKQGLLINQAILSRKLSLYLQIQNQEELKKDMFLWE